MDNICCYSKFTKEKSRKGDQERSSFLSTIKKRTMSRNASCPATIIQNPVHGGDSRSNYSVSSDDVVNNAYNTHHGSNNIWIIAFSKIRLTVFSYCKSFRSVDFTLKFPSGSESRLVANCFLPEREKIGIETRRWNFSLSLSSILDYDEMLQNN